VSERHQILPLLADMCWRLTSSKPCAI